MNKQNTVTSFTANIRSNLQALGVNFSELKREGAKFGLGISGGADSVSLFLALKEILKDEEVPLVAVTVNHHIRPKEETDADADFVENLVLSEKSFFIDFVRVELKEGQVAEVAELRQGGIEDAARFLRYEAFQKVIDEKNIKYFCLAHNQNDNLETALMKFLQGNPVTGIQAKRGSYIRPLWNIPREEIESFLRTKNQCWRTDKTNLDDTYFRNSIRLHLIPLLDEIMPGWRSGVLGGIERSLIDNDYFQKKALEFPWEKVSDSLECSAKEFIHSEDAVLYRALTNALNAAGLGKRIPLDFLKDVVQEIKKAYSNKKEFSKQFSGFEIALIKDKVLVKRWVKKQTDIVFFDIIKEEGKYYFPFGELTVKKVESQILIKKDGEIVSTVNEFPFVIRSPHTGEKKTIFVVEE